MLREIRRGNPHFPNGICPICGHEGWCATSEDTGKLFIICKRDTLKANVSIFKYIKDTNNEGNSLFVYEPSGSGYEINFQAAAKGNIVERMKDISLDCINRKLLSMLTLEDHHRQKLKTDGFTDELISRYSIKSFPVRDFERKKSNIQSKNPLRWQLAKELHNSYGDLKGFPGAFLSSYNDKTYWSLAGYDGILFPIENIYGEIVMMQIRLDNPSNGGKYRVLSSEGERFPHGCGPSSRVGLCKPKVLGDTYICYVTEGIKKAIITSERLGALTATVQGVNSWSELINENDRNERFIDILKNRYGTRIFIIAYDNDKYRNAKVMDSQKRVIDTLKNEGFCVGVAEWDSYCGKGIDDMLNNGYKPMYHIM
ncbi:MAG: DUF3854 domain-containing protein [Clostridia bacterium]